MCIRDITIDSRGLAEKRSHLAKDGTVLGLWGFTYLRRFTWGNNGSGLDEDIVGQIVREARNVSTEQSL